MPVYPKEILRVDFVMVAITASVADGAHTHTASGATVGSVTVPVSCSRKAQTHIERGLAMFHSFLFDDADLQFKTAANMDGGCAMQIIALALCFRTKLNCPLNQFHPRFTSSAEGWYASGRYSPMASAQYAML